jgi:hypothetical protein
LALTQVVCFFRSAVTLLYSISMIALISLAKSPQGTLAINSVERRGENCESSYLRHWARTLSKLPLFRYLVIGNEQPLGMLRYLLFPHLSFAEYELR